jgi:MFS family permease
LGAIIFGAMGDRVGRKATFLTTVSLMGGATFAIGLLPTYEQAGIIAPILLVFLRICQGTALGGEYGGAAIYVAEHAADNRRGAATGWIQASASFGLLAALLVIVATRTALGEDAFAAWGWRIPFLASILLLAISVWMRLKLSESPAFTKLRDDGAISKAPLREAFARRDSLKQVLIAFFAVMCAQGAVWYFTFFYLQVFLEKTLGLPGATKDMLLIAMTLVSAPLYVLFGWLSDRVGRKPVMLGGMLLALVLYIPGSHLIAGAVNPALVAAQERTPVVVSADPDSCSSQFDPTGTRRIDSACDIAKSLLVARGIGYSSKPLAAGAVETPGQSVARIMIGTETLAVIGGEGLDDAALKARKGDYGAHLKERLAAAGYPVSADPSAIDYPTLLLVLFGFVVAATALYGPQAAALVEMFPTKIRYTALSLPYHIGTGWVGGFLPVTSFAIVAITGNIYAGLWYAVGFTAISVVATVLLMKETSGRPLH